MDDSVSNLRLRIGPALKAGETVFHGESGRPYTSRGGVLWVARNRAVAEGFAVPRTPRMSGVMHELRVTEDCELVVVATPFDEVLPPAIRGHQQSFAGYFVEHGLPGILVQSMWTQCEGDSGEIMLCAFESTLEWICVHEVPRSRAGRFVV